MLPASFIHGRGHASDDLPRAVRSDPRVRDPHSIGPDFGACTVRPCEINSIIIGRDVARNLKRELLDRIGLKADSF